MNTISLNTISLPSINSARDAVKFAATYITCGAVTPALLVSANVIRHNIIQSLLFPFAKMLDPSITSQLADFNKILPGAIKAAGYSAVALATIPPTYFASKKMIQKFNEIMSIERTNLVIRAEVASAGMMAIAASILASSFIDPDLNLFERGLRFSALGIVLPTIGYLAIKEIHRISMRDLLDFIL